MRPLALASLLLAALTAAPALARDCPAAVPFGPGDRLADLSARCGVPAGAILRANDAADETALRQAGAVAIPQAPAATDPGLLERARNAAERTAERAEGAATRAGEAAADYLSDNDVGRDLLDLGRSAGLLPADAGSGEAQLSAVARGSDNVRIAATGLPGSQAVTIALVRGNGTMPLRDMRSEPDGTLLATIPRPDAGPEGDMVFALEADGRRLATASLRQP